MELEQTYQQVINQLKAGKRPMQKLSFDLRHEILETWKASFRENNLQNLEKCLCLLDHSQSLCAEFDSLFCQTLEQDFGPPIDIYALGASWKHVIQRRQRSGDRIPMEYIQCIEQKLKSQSPEVFEWALRTVDQLGPQSLLLKETILRRKPSLLKVFNPHYRMSREIIEMLEKRWSTQPRVTL